MTTIAPTAELKLVREADGLALDLAPLQGLWTEEQYLRLTDHTNRLIEFADGRIEALSMPTDKHQTITLFLYDLFRAFLNRTGGKVLVAALRLRIREGKYREPDLLLLRDAHDARRQNRYWLGADLVVKVVSEDDPERDTVAKVADYAEAGIPEYWIVNPLNETITVLRLEGDAYVAHSVFGRGTTAVSALLVGFGAPVADVFDAE